jgi:hypothetical protein
MYHGLLSGVIRSITCSSIAAAALSSKALHGTLAPWCRHHRLLHGGLPQRPGASRGAGRRCAGRDRLGGEHELRCRTGGSVSYQWLSAGCCGAGMMGSSNVMFTAAGRYLLEMVVRSAIGVIICTAVGQGSI